MSSCPILAPGLECSTELTCAHTRVVWCFIICTEGRLNTHDTLIFSFNIFLLLLSTQSWTLSKINISFTVNFTHVVCTKYSDRHPNICPASGPAHVKDTSLQRPGSGADMWQWSRNQQAEQTGIIKTSVRLNCHHLIPVLVRQIVSWTSSVSKLDGDSVRPAPSHGVCFGPGGSHGGRFHQSLISEQLLEVDDMLLTVLSWWHTCTNINTSSNEALMLKKESEVKACVCFFIFSRDIMIKPTGSQWEGNVFSSELTSPFLWEGADYSEDDMNRRQETTPCFRGWTLSLDLSCRLLNVQLCVFSLTGVEAGTSSQPLVSLLERPEHGVEQHLVSGLLRRVQELPGRHVVVATCSPWHQWGLVHFKVWILWVCQKSYCWLWSFMETRSSSS